MISPSPFKYLAESSLDSLRFGIKVMRGTFESEANAANVVTEIDRSEADLVIFRVPAGDTSVSTSLLLKGHVVIHADTLVYYASTLDKASAPSPEPNVELANASHREAIAAIAKSGFSDYRAHYAANPLIPRDLVLAGYTEWALSRLKENSGDSATWVVIDDGSPAGFATCDVSGDSVEIILNAVHPKFERRGLYGMLLRHIQHHYANHGLRQLLISTQIWNYTVQRQWSRNGLLLRNAYDTYHVDRRLRLPAPSP